MKIKRYDSIDEKLVKDFNIRLKINGIDFQFPEKSESILLPKISGRETYQEYFLLFDDNQVIRGGYILKYQNFFINGNYYKIADYQLPLSEGIINKEYSFCGLLLYKNALKKSPLLFGLGMGGLNEKLPTMLRVFGWDLRLVPFYFRIFNFRVFINNIYFFKNKKILKRVLNNSLIIHILKSIVKLYELYKIDKNITDLQYEVVGEFDSWADDIWGKSKDYYDFIAKRDKTNLNILYPKNNRKYIRIKVSSKSKVVGWIILLKTKMNKHKQFGNMYLGSIVDCLSLKNYEKETINCGLKYLIYNKVDLVVSNQSSYQWCLGIEKNGFIRGPSNFVLGISKKLSKLFFDIDVSFKKFHFNRGDGDGPINL